MGRRLTSLRSVVTVVALGAAAACGATPPVEVERADAIAGALVPDRPASVPDASVPDAPLPDAAVPGTPLPDAAPRTTPASTGLDWEQCGPYGAPSDEVLGTAGWECSRLEVPLDPFDPDADLVELAVTRHRATGDRLGALIVNPGGPGGSGLDAVWGIRRSMPFELVRAVDIVSWDPRGVGASTPPIRCPAGSDPGDAGFVAACADLTGELAAHLAAPYHVADLEALRAALAEPRLDYLGYSYGTILGAMYAAAHPERVGAFVLDGATDPLTGTSDGPDDDGFPVFSESGEDAARARFVELCDATDRCLPGLSTTDVLGDIEAQVGLLPTADFAGEPERVGTDDFLAVVEYGLTWAGDWELVATALADAAVGDASALAALLAGDPEFAPGDDGVSEFGAANYLIYCADLAELVERWSFCDGMPDNARRLEPVVAVDVAQPVLVIGTDHDPLTPGTNAPAFADALGDAVHLRWEGVGHTAFPGWTRCIDDVVVAHVLERRPPPDGSVCEFIEGVESDEALADELFGHGADVRGWLADVVAERGVAGDPSCVADVVAEELDVDPVRGDRIVSHVLLDVTSDAATEVLERARSSC